MPNNDHPYTGVVRRGGVWWILLCVHGTVYRESTGIVAWDPVKKKLINAKKAKDKRADRLGELRKWARPKTGKRADQVRFKHLAELLLNDVRFQAKVNGRDDRETGYLVRRTESRLSHLSAFLPGGPNYLMVGITTATQKAYITWRLDGGARHQEEATATPGPGHHQP